MVLSIKNCLISLLMTGICMYVLAEETKETEETETRYTNLFMSGYIDASEDIKADNYLDFTSFGIKTYSITEWGMRVGGGINLLISTRELIEGENSFIYGGIFSGFFLGQELRIWQIIFSVNLLLGAGVSISNLWTSPWHIDYFGEINAEAGILLREDFSVNIFTGFQNTGNLFPQFPCTAYLMYYPVWGISITW